MFNGTGAIANPIWILLLSLSLLSLVTLPRPCVRTTTERSRTVEKKTIAVSALKRVMSASENRLLCGGASIFPQPAGVKRKRLASGDAADDDELSGDVIGRPSPPGF